MKKINFLLLMSILVSLFYACDSESYDLQEKETFQTEEVLSQGALEQMESRKKLPPVGSGNDCDYVLGILDEYLDGTQSGANFVYLNAGGNFPLGTTYTWTIKRQDGSTQYYPASTSNPRRVSASISNRITRATVTAEYSGCQKTVIKTFLCAIPNEDANGNLFPECY